MANAKRGMIRYCNNKRRKDIQDIGFFKSMDIYLIDYILDIEFDLKYNEYEVYGDIQYINLKNECLLPYRHFKIMQNIFKKIKKPSEIKILLEMHNEIKNRDFTKMSHEYKDIVRVLFYLGIDNEREDVLRVKNIDYDEIIDNYYLNNNEFLKDTMDTFINS